MFLISIYEQFGRVVTVQHLNLSRLATWCWTKNIVGSGWTGPRWSSPYASARSREFWLWSSAWRRPPSSGCWAPSSWWFHRRAAPFPWRWVCCGRPSTWWVWLNEREQLGGPSSLPSCMGQSGSLSWIHSKIQAHGEYLCQLPWASHLLRRRCQSI